MLEKYYFDKPSHTDLNLYRCGIEDCKPGHSWGPAIRDHYIIHYIRDGKGIYRVNNTTYHLEKGDGFLIVPNTIVFYQADIESPWSYSWVGFHGLKADSYLKRAGLTVDSPIFRYVKDNSVKECLKKMIDTKNLTSSREICLLGYLYILLSYIIEASETAGSKDNTPDRKESYIKKAVEFISKNYSRKITVSEIASYVGLDRSYLYTLFNSYLNTSPQEFLVNFRINKACELMKNANLSIANISRSVGYEDPLLFSKMFRKAKGLSPREYRKELS